MGGGCEGDVREDVSDVKEWIRCFERGGIAVEGRGRGCGLLIWEPFWEEGFLEEGTRW